MIEMTGIMPSIPIVQRIIILSTPLAITRPGNGGPFKEDLPRKMPRRTRVTLWKISPQIPTSKKAQPAATITSSSIKTTSEEAQIVFDLRGGLGKCLWACPQPPVAASAHKRPSLLGSSPAGL